MKYIFNIMLSVLALVFGTSLASAGDKFKPLREISPYPTPSSIVSIASTSNEATTPVELSNPDTTTANTATTIDNAIKPPPKSEPMDASTANALEDIFVEPKPVEIKKPLTHKAKERAKKAKKRHANTKLTKPLPAVKKKPAEVTKKKK